MRKAKVWDARQLPAYLTVAQYGELMGICPKTVRRMCQRGSCRHTRRGRSCGASTRTPRWSSGRSYGDLPAERQEGPEKQKARPVLEHRRASE